MAELGATSLGIWTRREALTRFTPAQIDTRTRRGDWQVLWRGVYADASTPLTPLPRAVAGLLAVGGSERPVLRGGEQRRQVRAVACGRMAARIWQIPLIEDRDPATGAYEHLLDDVAVTRHLPDQGWAGRTLLPQQRWIPRTDRVRLAGGLWVTTPLQTAVDLCVLQALEPLVCALDGALHTGQVALADLEQACAEHEGNRGAPLLRQAISLADARAEAPSETLARLLLLPVLPGLTPQVELCDDAARVVARFDLGDRTARFAVEADGKAAHAGAEMVAKDRRRDRRTEAYGWRTERVTWFDLRRRQGQVIQEVLATYERHLLRPAS